MPADFDTTTKKSLGQHFLHERHIIERILHALSPQAGEHLVEIGPGQGALTLPLLRRHGRLTAIEFDRDLLAPLRAAAQPHGALEIIHANVLDIDLTALADGRTIRLLGNLPYNLSSPILFHALAHAHVVHDMHFMLQREVVERMSAAPGSKIYGRLSVMLQAYCTVNPLFRVSPGAFRPPPKVDSALVRLTPRPVATIGIANHRRFAALVRAAFGQRRKTLRNALKGTCPPTTLTACGINPDSRAEQLAADDFIRLSNALAGPSR